ncbi:MAG: sialate O-acetylesterase [Planctomycetes bacterium]|nr:sialate O-acetylesterase [Planctomycetota bacterium]
MSRVALLSIALATALAAQQHTVKVFVLAGQSNMEGKAQNVLLDHQATDPDTAKLFAHLRRDDQWIVRDDVFIKFFDRKGGLTIGYGSPNRTGMELEFGTALGEHFAEPVLLIKTAWGGHSLAKDFRPPSAGLPDAKALADELGKAQERVRQRNAKDQRNEPLPTIEDLRDGYGRSYRAMLTEVRDTMTNAGTLFPTLAGRPLELAGFVWFQGWNDQYGGFETQYADNLAHLIRDLRKDLAATDLPFVIAVMGQNGSQPATGAMAVIQDAQRAVAALPEFAATVRAVATDELVDKVAEAAYPTWEQDKAAWQRVGSDHPYHYLGSAIWFSRIGKACASAMLELRRKS